MCVDFAYKQIEQHGDKWALRNIKLRMARRLIYVKGLLMCARLFETDWDIERIKEELRNYALTPPIEFMVATFIEYGISNDIISQALDTYNVYLGLLNNEGFREEMTSLNMYKAYGNANFEMARENSHRFLNALTNVFLNEENKIGRFTIKYGVF